MKCECNMRTKLVGDGCEVCNPAYALEHAKLTIADLTADNERLRNLLCQIRDGRGITARDIDEALEGK